ncbi:cation diffusion facilitator family transporter [Comamonas aquatica]|uniref:cation diffusion facilitator family transporter n=1 Tax=Comamonas aquatica TaxID=225991 RepID=UPI0028D40488|nr:cation diffusion facilitator family transporter [Comamonas aquatica]
MAEQTPARTSDWMRPHSLLRISIAVAVVTIVLKMLAWLLTGSVGLLSDALESFVNLAGATFALAMVTIAQRPADDDHPYGHHKAEYFSAGFEGLLVIGASLAIIWVSVARWMDPQPLQRLDWGLGLSLASTVLNGALAWLMFRSARTYRSMALEGDARHLMTDVYTSVGVVLGLGLAHLSGWWWLDPLAGVVVALNILWHGAVLLWRASQGLMDIALDPEQLAQIDAVLQAQTQAAQLQTGEHLVFDSLHTRQAGGHSFIDLHLHVPGEWTLAQAADWRQRTEAALMAAIPRVQARIELLPQGAATVLETEMGTNR